MPIINPVISINVQLLGGIPLQALIFEIIFLSAHTVLMLSILILVADQLFY
jgi:hypothetical protein